MSRKAQLDKLLRGRAQGISVAPFERGQIGPDLFTAACRMRLEGIVSKHQARRYRGPVTGSRSRTGSIRRSVG